MSVLLPQETEGSDGPVVRALYFSTEGVRRANGVQTGVWMPSVGTRQQTGSRSLPDPRKLGVRKTPVLFSVLGPLERRSPTSILDIRRASAASGGERRRVEGGPVRSLCPSPLTLESPDVDIPTRDGGRVVPGRRSLGPGRGP